MSKSTLYFHRFDVIPGKAIRIFAEDESGRYVGEYDGYYNQKTGAITLYPAKKRFFFFGKCYKHTISDRLLRRMI